MNGASYTTGMVHKAKEVPNPRKGKDGTSLQQVCGMGRRQVAYLAPTTDPVTCKRCLAAG